MKIYSGNHSGSISKNNIFIQENSIPWCWCSGAV
jgi:hypothetical protein